MRFHIVLSNTDIDWSLQKFQRDESRPGFKPNLWAACCRIILNACNKLVLNSQSVTATISAGKRRSCRYIFFLHKFSSFRAKVTFATTAIADHVELQAQLRTGGPTPNTSENA